MKLLTTTLAAMLAATTAMADLSDRNDGITHQIMCSNVPAQSGSVPGFFAPNLGYFVEAAYADSVTTSYLGGVMPAGLSAKDSRDVEAFLTSLGLTNYELVIRDRERERIVEEPVARNTFDGEPQDWRVTSMDGTNTVRVRTLDDRPVQLRIGGNVVLETSGVGQAYFDLPAGQSFGGLKIHDAATGEALRNGTASTNGAIWDATVETVQTFTRNGRWCR